MAKVIVGLSGGVDSAVAAYLLQQEGYEVIGVTVRSWESGISRCCEIDDAQATADLLGIPYRVINCVPDFQDKIEKPFVSSYLNGETPNPCVLCNPEIKWKWMLYAASLYGADMVATGHYASVVLLPNGRYAVKKGADKQKDQSYMLYRLTQDQLAKTLFPLGDLTKDQVRAIASQAQIPSAGKPDSQEICFIPDGSYSRYIEDHVENKSSFSGSFVDEDGNILGQHSGIFRYTIGQRKGLGLALGSPAYVTSIRPRTKEVVVGSEESLYSLDVTCRSLNTMAFPNLQDQSGLPVTVKIRYHHEGTPATLTSIGEDQVLLHFDLPVRAATPGQSAVFYDSSGIVIGGGIITR